MSDLVDVGDDRLWTPRRPPRVEGYRTTGRYASGRRVWVWARVGRTTTGGWWAHLEVGPLAVHFGRGEPRRVRRASWQRWPR
jgi:hypothetical protein